MKYTTILKSKLLTCFAMLVLFASGCAFAVELVVGEKRVAPGIVFIFEGAVKDTITPAHKHLPENKTDVHIEARANWDTKDLPKGAVPGGFIPYLDIVAKVKNQKTGAVLHVDLLPHINLIDNFHYARNIALPGKRNDLYEVTFTVVPPGGETLGLHIDWTQSHGKALMEKTSFTYQSVNFEEIAKATRR